MERLHRVYAESVLDVVFAQACDLKCTLPIAAWRGIPFRAAETNKHRPDFTLGSLCFEFPNGNEVSDLRHARFSGASSVCRGLHFTANYAYRDNEHWLRDTIAVR